LNCYRCLLALCLLIFVTSCQETAISNPVDVTLPTCTELSGVSAIFLESRVEDVDGEVTWMTPMERFTRLVPEDAIPSVRTPLELEGVEAFTSTDPTVPDDYLPNFVELPARDGYASLFVRVNVLELCGASPPEVALPVWISSESRSITWLLR